MRIDALDFAPGISGVRLFGRLDVAGAAEVETKLLAATVAKGQPAVIDMTGVDFIASMGIGALIAVSKGLALKHCRLALFGPQPMVMTVLEHAGLSNVLTICDTPEDAIRRVSA